MRNVYYLKMKLNVIMIDVNIDAQDVTGFVIAKPVGTIDAIIKYVKMDLLQVYATKEIYISIFLKCIMKYVLLHQQHLKWGSSTH